ncbi:uncharacterized protein LOC111630994 [Centruroides sculpturatus]|uniref:uncharacterized protein LOC111630994 n=1 Tax=Centruroides sculpturatus TaxID=218467 RepID=UPI000C6EB745|nr:uncharacterized protein LOC111630994 [Centruroides sculpturatus]
MGQAEGPLGSIQEIQTKIGFYELREDRSQNVGVGPLHPSRIAEKRQDMFFLMFQSIKNLEISRTERMDSDINDAGNTFERLVLQPSPYKGRKERTREVQEALEDMGV